MNADMELNSRSAVNVFVEEDIDILILIPGFRSVYNRRKMKPDQVKDVDRRIRAALQAQGYRILKEDAA